MFTQEEVEKMPRQNITAEQFIKRADIEQEWIKEEIRNLDNGTFLAVSYNKKSKKYSRLHLKSIWVKKFNLNYSCHKDIKKGKELLISNLPLPKGDVVQKK